jgi:RWP-RK domain
MRNAPDRINSTSIEPYQLRSLFHVDINTAADKLGVCATTLKKACRRAGLHRWPHRKLQSIARQLLRLGHNGAVLDCDDTKISALRIQYHKIITTQFATLTDVPQRRPREPAPAPAPPPPQERVIAPTFVMSAPPPQTSVPVFVQMPPFPEDEFVREWGRM